MPMFGLLILEITCDIFESGYCQHKNASKYGITGSLFLLFLYITTTSNRINHIPTPAKYLTHMLQKAGFNIFMHKTPSSNHHNKCNTIFRFNVFNVLMCN